MKHTPPTDHGPLFAPHNGTATSKAAAKAIEPHINEQHKAMLFWYHSYGTGGLTDAEMIEATGFSGDSVRPRRGELVAINLVADSGRTRATKTGRQATVYVAKEYL